MITGINRITLSVLDLDRSFKFYTEVLGCKPIARWKQGAYLLAGNLWLCLFLDEKTRKVALPE
jgi:catechol 2,3-dioxygenase-like lactoylglutathione lyase family enzyme